jgi:hypothetical protein
MHDLSEKAIYVIFGITVGVIIFFLGLSPQKVTMERVNYVRGGQYAAYTAQVGIQDTPPLMHYAP